jgi:cytochrome c oxidase cbb3-type subunit 3
MLKSGRPDQGMPAFNLNATDANAVVAFIHTQKKKFETLGGGRRSVDPSDLATGNAEAGRAYFTGAGQCSTCHSPTGDLAGIAARYQGLALLQRLLYPTAGRPAPARPKATITLSSGETITGPLQTEDEFSLTILDAAGARQTYDKTAVKFKIDDPMSAHFDQLAKYTDADMHNIYRYLDTLK